MHNIFYAKALFVMILVLFFSITFSGCSNNFNYSTINTSAYETELSFELPQAEKIVTITEETLEQEYIFVDDNIITFNDPNFVNYELSEMNNYIFVFNTDAIVTISSTLRSSYSTMFISFADNLYINLTGKIFTGQAIKSLPFELSTNCSIFANNLFIIGKNSKISSLSSLIIDATETTLSCSNLSFSSSDVCIKSDILNIKKSTHFAAKNPLFCRNICYFGGIQTIIAENIAILCDNIIINNGYFQIKAPTIIDCKNLTFNNGYFQSEGKNGIYCQTCIINNGYLFSVNKFFSIKATREILITNGTIFLVTSMQGHSALETETANVSLTGGILVCNSDYVYCLKTNSVLTSCQKNSPIVLINDKSNLTIVPYVDGSLSVFSTQQFKFLATGRINSFDNNFFGVIFNASLNTLSEKTINYPISNFGAKTYNCEAAKHGQIL